MKNDDVLPEEVEAHNQPLIEELRRAYQPELQDARALTRIRKRLLARDGWRTQIEPTSLFITQQREKSGTMNRQRSNVNMRKPKRWRHVLGLVAAVLTVSLLVGTLVLTLKLAYRTSTGTEAVNSYVTPETLIDIHMFSDSSGWALSTDNRVLRTIDGGVNWKEVTPPDLLGLGKRFHLAGPWTFHDAFTAWVAVTVNERQTPEYHSSTAALIFHTTNGGTTWQKTVLKLSGQRANQLLFVNAHVGWLLSMPDVTIQGPERDTPFDIWHTADGGTTWTKILDGSSSSAQSFHSITTPTISFGDEQVGLMVGQNNRLYRTVDGGATWHIQPWPGATGSVVNFGAPHFFTTKDALFTSTAMTSGSSGVAQKVSVVVYTTHDAGLTWHTSPSLSLGAPQNKQVRSNAPMFIDMQHGWVWASTDLTMTVTGNPSLVQYMTIDGGEHWTQVPVSSILNNYRSGFEYSSSSFISPSVGWLADMGSEGVVLLKTVDGGHTWVQIHALFPSFVRVPSASS
jgi:photosystem II stability/assembly factor-like uncharacterized protein